MERIIVWNKRPSKFLSKVLRRISEDSPLQAESMEKVLLDSINSIISNPEKYPPDKFKKNNSGHF